MNNAIPIFAPPRPVNLARDELAVAEATKYRAMWARPEYRRWSPGEAHAPVAAERLGMKWGDTLYDLGCGAGAAVPEFARRGLLVRAIDIALSPELIGDAVQKTKHLPLIYLPMWTIACLWSLPLDYPRRDWVFCCDVLEHIPPAKVGAVLDAIARLMKKGGYLTIHCGPDGMGKLIGETLHLTVREPEWWVAEIRQRMHVKSAEGAGGEVTVIVAPKPEAAHVR